MIAEPMKLEWKTTEPVAILKVRGLLANRPNLTPFYHQLTHLQETGQTHVVVDLSNTTGCGAALLGWLINAQQTLRKKGGDLYLTGLSEQIHRILKLTQLSGQFQTFKTTEQAMARFQKELMYCAA
jgi:anti-anti-sigma factor